MLKHCIILSYLFASLTGLLGQTFVETFRFGQSGANEGQFNHPSAVAISDEGILFVVDSGNNRIQLFDLKGNFLKSVGGFGFEADQFDFPTDIWVKSLLNIYVSDYNNQRIQRYDRQMNFIAQFTSNPNWPQEFQFGQVLSCAVNSQNDMFVLDHLENKIVKFNRNGQPEVYFGHYNAGAGELIEPQQLDIFNNQWLVVTDLGQKALLLFDFFGNLLKVVQSKQFVRPRGLATHGSGVIAVADDGANRIFTYLPQSDSLQSWQFVLQKPLQMPVDVALFNVEKERHCVILDGNQVIVGSLKE